jgi:P-type Cu2+ transporter
MQAPVTAGQADPVRSVDAGREGCFHCGLPLAGAQGLQVAIDGAVRPMCCAGCQAVAQAIVDAGLTSYYRHRAAMPASSADTVPAELSQLALYDDPAVQSSFVRRLDHADPTHDEREAALLIEGITCAACVWLTERSLAAVPGVTGVEVNYATRRARVRWDSQRTALSTILAAVARIGYRAWPFDAERVENVQRRERSRALAGLAIAGLGMMQVMMYAVPAYIGSTEVTADASQLMRWAGLILTLPVLLYSAAPFFTSAWRDLRARRLGMDVPVAIGIGAAFSASAWATLSGQGDVYFDSVSMFVFLLLAARFLESQVRARAGRATDELARLIPAQAERYSSWPDSPALQTVPVARLAVGDVVLVRPGARIPADGCVLDGAGEVDESLLTGESRPVLRGPGAALTGGAVNLVSPLVMRVERIGEHTVVAGIVRLLDRASAQKPPLAALADRVAARFVFGLLAVATGTALWWGWHDPQRALWVTVAVLVITCPCALSLATPAALAAASSALARRGLLATRGHAIETLARATHFVFDKTGTLTTGRLRVRAAWFSSGDAGRTAALAMVAALEQRSEHPIARALGEHALAQPGAAVQAPLLQITALRHVAGSGIEARVDGELVRLGAPAYVAALCAELETPAALEGHAEDTWIELGSRHGLIARFALADSLRSGASELISGLRAAGAEVILLSGDQQTTVDAVARRLGIPADTTHARGNASPQDKLDVVRALQSRGAVVAMFGDGINDAPVLAQAQVSVALGSGTQVAQSAADMVWLAGGAGHASADLRQLLAAVMDARRALRVIRQNLGWAVAYNAVALPLAVAGLVNPWTAALGMSASSLLVAGNAMRLLGRVRRDGDVERPQIGRPTRSAQRSLAPRAAAATTAATAGAAAAAAAAPVTPQ